MSGGTRRELVHLFDAAAAARPTAVALEVAGHVLTYGELDAAADRVAALLWRDGQVPARVGLLASRSVGAYAGYLGTLRAGATVVPLATGVPAERTVMLARMAALDAVLVDDPRTEAAGALAGARFRVCDAEDPAGGGPARTRPSRRAGARIAYILFTSGSTGTPKGVPVTHESILSFVDFNVARYRVEPDARLSQTFDFSFDPSLFDMFVGWAAGAAVVVPAQHELMDPAAFVRDRRITHWFSVPSLVSAARRLRRLESGSMPTLRWSLFAGEQLTLEQAEAWWRAAPASTIENLYGPTELAVTVSAYRLPPDVSQWPQTPNGTVPIGDVYPHLEGLVVDEEGFPARSGELLVRGPQRFSGYLDPADDAGAFASFDGTRARLHPGAGPPDDSHWYRTADRVVSESYGLVHLGRIDAQLKIRGHRVEPGEIEAALRRRPEVVDVVVVAVRGAVESHELHAVYTGRPAPQSDLAAFLRTILPPYMVPRRYVHADRLPLTASGKVDRVRIAELLARSGDGAGEVRSVAGD